jgi:uncharacterized protein YijF (DUF1287 family)
MRKSKFSMLGMPVLSLAFGMALIFGACDNLAAPGTETPEQPARSPSVDIDLNLVGKIIAPVKGATTVTTAINAAQYTGTVTWQKTNGSAHSGAFAASTVYEAVIRLTAKAGYAFTGVEANSFHHAKATSVTNAAGDGTTITVIITFMATAADPGADPGTDPGADPGTDDPGTDPGADPGTDDPGTDPGADPGTDDPGTDPGVDPGTDDPGTDDPGTDDPGTDPGTDDPPDTTLPAPVTGVTRTAGNGQVTLAWTNPADPDLASVEISWTPGNGTVSVADALTYTATGLTNGRTYTFILKAVNTAGNRSAGASITATPRATVSALNLTTLVAKPAKAATPVATEINTYQYTGTVAWQKANGSAHSGAFAASTVYKAVVGLTAKTGYTFTGVEANSFRYTGATSVTNAAGNGTTISVTISFPKTEANPGTDNPGTDNPGTDNPGTDDPGTDDPGTDDPGTDDPGTDDPGTDDPANPTLPTSGLIAVEFTGPQDENINLLYQTQDRLSWQANTVLSVSVSEGFTVRRWDLDGKKLSGNNSRLTLYAGTLSVKRHKLTVFVTKGDVEYAKILEFTVRP